jgi:hypothetical protein
MTCRILLLYGSNRSDHLGIRVKNFVPPVWGRADNPPRLRPLGIRWSLSVVSKDLRGAGGGEA